MEPLCLYRGNSGDGFGAALAVRCVQVPIGWESDRKDSGSWVKPKIA